jgi:hypothetical protein
MMGMYKTIREELKLIKEEHQTTISTRVTQSHLLVEEERREGLITKRKKLRASMELLTTLVALFIQVLVKM